MNILQVTNFLYTVGGGSSYFFNLSKLLKQKGHKIFFFSTDRNINPTSGTYNYVVRYVSSLNINSLLNVFFNREAENKINYLLLNNRIDIVHIHDISHYISPSILSMFKKWNIPIIMTVHDYHLISPNRNMFHDGKICEITKPDKYWKAIYHKCIKNSYLFSTIEVLEKYFQRLVGWERNYIDYYICPSKFMAYKLEEYGVLPEKIIFLPNYINSVNNFSLEKKKEYILYFGRLSYEKGLDLVTKVMIHIPRVKLILAGVGHLEKILKIHKSANNINNIELIGFKKHNELNKLIQKCRFTILPSLWYENAPMSILESFACGKPVVASRIGGIPELVKEGYNGLLFEPGNVEDCKEKILRLWNDRQLCRKMGENARDYVEKNFNPEDHYQKLMSIYRKAIELHK